MADPGSPLRRWWQRLRGATPPTARAAARTPAIVPTAPLVVPDRFVRNSSTVLAVMPAEQSGLWLLERLRATLSLASWAGVRMLDFGCGVRFTQAILSGGVPLARYVGVDCYREMIDFLRTEVQDPRFAFHTLDVAHPLYNPGGATLSPATPLPTAERDFDVVTLFSVITHQRPDDAASLLAILRRHVAARGHLFLTAFLDDAVDGWEDRSPERNGGRCVFHSDRLAEIVERSGWLVASKAPAEPPLIADGWLLRPA